MKQQSRSYVYAFAAIACWSTVGSAFKLTLRHTDPQELLVISSLVAVVALLTIMFFRGGISSLMKLGIKDLLSSAFLGLLNPFLYYTVLLKAYDMLPAQEAGTLNYIWPLALSLLSVPLLKQRISRMSLVAILISFLGIVLIAYHPVGVGDPVRVGDPVGVPGSDHLLGIFLALGSALFWALYWIFNLRDPREAVGKLLLNFCFGFVYTLLYVTFTGGFTLPAWQGIAGSIYIGLFEMGFTFVLWLNALKYSATTAKVANLIYLSPFISLIIIHFAVGEQILPSTVAGLILIVSGILFQQYLKR